jgi:hypothetical protein
MGVFHKLRPAHHALHLAFHPTAFPYMLLLHVVKHKLLAFCLSFWDAHV